uniref:Uncharacterized protein n=1 Tax=Cannabis sativa TaxID=3483 RepID=A0A803PVV4_CANSA
MWELCWSTMASSSTFVRDLEKECVSIVIEGEEEHEPIDFDVMQHMMASLWKPRKGIRFCSKLFELSPKDIVKTYGSFMRAQLERKYHLIGVHWLRNGTKDDNVFFVEQLSDSMGPQVIVSQIDEGRMDKKGSEVLVVVDSKRKRAKGFSSIWTLMWIRI